MVIILLSVALVAAAGGLAYALITLDAANTRIDKQEREIEKQKELIEKKETFGAAMEGLVDTVVKFDGTLTGGIVPLDEYDVLAARAWAHRWNAVALDQDAIDAQAAATDLEAVLAAASVAATTNSTGTTNEAITDQLGGGFVASVFDDADALCESDVIGCVLSEDPHTVHFDTGDSSVPYMNDWLRTGVAYHEFAHVLQFTHPEESDIAAESFGGDYETMADCFALTYLDGWTLDHRIYVGRYEYWDVSVGYGYTCDEPQRQVVRDWYAKLPFVSRPISQER